MSEDNNKKDESSSIESIEKQCKEKGINIKDLLGGSVVTYAMIPWLKTELAIDPYVQRYKELSKQLTEHYKTISEKLDDEELIKYIQKTSVSEEMLLCHIHMNEVNIKAIKVVQSRKKEKELKKQEGKEEKCGMNKDEK